MKTYLDMARRVLEHGEIRPNRTGVDTLSLFAQNYSVDLRDGFPLLTTKQMNWQGIVAEFLWLMSGEDHIRELRKHTKVWNPWADKDGRVDSAYGNLWRRWPSARRWVDDTGRDAWRVEEVDQVRWIAGELVSNPWSRRLVLTAWEPGNAMASRLPPCHFAAVFSASVQRGTLSCHVTQRSGDIALGVPWDLAEYALLTTVLAQQAGLTAAMLSHTIVNAHIYVNHLDGIREQLGRRVQPLPTLAVRGDAHWDSLVADDLQLRGYTCTGPIKFPVAV